MKNASSNKKADSSFGKKKTGRFYDDYDPSKTSHKKGKPFRKNKNKRSYLD
jgi:hypothetical protein